MESQSQHLQEELGKVVAATIRPLSLGFGLFIGYTAWSEWDLVGTSHWTIFAADVAVSVYLLALFAWVQFRRPPLTWMNGLGASIGIALAGTDMVTNAVRASIPAFPAFALVLAGLGAVVLSWRWMVGTVAGLWVAWIAMTQVYVPDPWGSLFILQITTITGLAIHWGRIHAYRNLVQAREAEASARHRLEVANAELDRFASVVAHDLKNPISAMRLKAGIMRYKIDDRDTDSLRVLEEMDHVAKGMGDMVADLLDYARAREKHERRRMLDMDALMEEVVEVFEERLQARGGRIDLAPLPQVYGDPTLIRQLMQNLIGNALDHKQDGPPVVKVRGRARPDGVTLDVEDNGPGVDPQEVDTMFQPFARGRESLGHGLGLATCRRIVESHGGTIKVDGEKGKGSTFTVFLPQSVPAAPIKQMAPDVARLRSP